jgi:hypothetical protein
VAGDELNFGGIGRLLAMTPNNEVNALTAERYERIFGGESVYQLQLPSDDGDRDGISRLIGGRELFPETITYDDIEQRFQSGARVMTVPVNKPDTLRDYIPNTVLPLFVMPDDETLTIWTHDDPPALREGFRLIALVESGQYDDLIKRGAIHPADDDLNAGDEQRDASPADTQ